MPKPPATGRPPTIGYGSIRADEVLPVRELCRRLGWQKKTLSHARREGLQTIQFGRLAYALGADVVRFFQRLRDGQGPGEGTQ
jgi:hypothetical protein